jgi:hypothetical protein
MVDRSFLAPAAFEIVVVADTHYLPDPGDRPLEFESRRRQAGRAEHALRLTAALAPDLVIHLGDLAQSVPESADHAQTLDEAVAQLARCGVRPYHVAGNQDIGDKPDPTMPTGPVTPATLAAFEAHFGPTWYALAAGDWRIVVLNSQIMNSALPAARDQQRWLEAELAAHAGARVVVCLHLPLFLRDADDPDLGHYDTLGQPARGWLLDLCRRYRLELVLSGHAHWSFVNLVGSTRLVVCPSTSHTRPGFSELFSSAPPPEQGRDDAPKLGITLARLHDDGPRLHLLRTYGVSGQLDLSSARLLTRLSRDLPASPLGVTLTHPLAPVAAVPLAWPSVVRQPVRNDYPLLTCLELGVRYVRVPAADLDDPAQRPRLALLRAEGVALIAGWLWRDGLDLAAAVDRHRDLVDSIEVQMPGARWPDAAALTALAAVRERTGLPVTLTSVLPGEPVAGKQLRRTRIGYRLDEVAELDGRLAAAGASIDRVLCRLTPEVGGRWTALDQIAERRYERIGALDWALDPAATDPAEQLARAAAALFAVVRAPGTRLYLEPLLDLDRTMDVSLGLLDRQSNPRPVVNALRAINTVVFGHGGAAWPLPTPPLAGMRVEGLEQPGQRCWLALPGAAPATLDLAALTGAADGAVTVIDLATATSRSLTWPAADEPAARHALPGPTLIVSRPDPPLA